MLQVLDLFSGIGGFSLGLERTGGFRTVAFCEIDPFCRKVLNKNWPKVPVYEDVRTLTARKLGEEGIQVDAIAGGFPCQDISYAGSGAGLSGARSGLWSEFARLIGELRPKVIFVENVSALLTRGHGVVLSDLATLGYDAEWNCIPAACVGAEHERDRVWIVAYPNRERELQPEGRERQVKGWVGDSIAASSSDADSSRCSGRLQAGENQEDVGDIRPGLRFAIDDASTVPRDYWDHQPVLGRGVHGVPNRVDRVGSLGNAVVPQVPEMLGRAYLSMQNQEPS